MPATDEMFTIEPPPAWRMAGMAYFVPRKTPLAFTAITRSHSAAVRSSIATRGMTIAALLIRMSSRPWRPVASLTAFCQSASFVTSRCTYAASPPPARMAVSTFLPSASRMSPKTTFAPSLANVSASAAPCPRAPPLMSATFPSSLPISVSLFGRPSARGRGVCGDPVLGDVDAACDPHAPVPVDIVQRALETRGARRMPDEPHVQPERYHLGLRLALAVEHVEAVLHEGEIVVGGEEAAAAELRIVRREAVRHDQMRTLVHAHPVGQLVVVGVRVVEKAALLDQEAPRVHAGPVAAVPAHRPLADRLLQRLDGHPDMRALLGFGELVVLDPPPPYDSDAYNDELPYWVRVNERPHLVVPYSLTANDSKFGRGGFFTADDYFTFVKDGFDVLYREGRTEPKMMSLGLHMRLIGHPSRAAGLERALDYMSRHKGVWFTRRLDIAKHWAATHPAPAR